MATRTNKSKLLAWDADFYNSLSDDVCLICLSEKQRYLLGQAVEQTNWLTRWSGDTSNLDLDAINGELQYRLADMSTCNDVGSILTIINNMQTLIDTLNYQVAQIYNENTTVNAGGVSPDTTVGDYNPPGLNTPFTGTETFTCGTDAERDAAYGAARNLVDFILVNNSDFLEQVEQNFGNVAENAENLISAVPLLGSLPFDEMVQWSAWCIENLRDEYQAELTESLKQALYCDIYCLVVANNCKLSYADLFNYFISKLPTGVNIFVRSIASAIDFALTGNLVGVDYIYWLCMWQLEVVALGQAWFGTEGFRPYEFAFAAGANSPDNDWSIYCLDCPAYFRHYAWDFADGAGIWTVVAGSLGATGIEGPEAHDGIRAVVLEYVFPSIVTIVGAITTHTRQGTRFGGSNDASAVRGYGNDDFTNEIFFTGAGGEGDGEIVICNQPIAQNIRSIRVSCVVDGADFPDNSIIQNKIDLFFTTAANYGELEEEHDICV
jgi:hypothetical protein